MNHTSKRVSLALPPSDPDWIVDFLFLLSPPAPSPDVTIKLNPRYTSSQYNLDDITGISNCEKSITTDIHTIFNTYWKDGNENKIMMFWLIVGGIWLIIGAIISFLIIPNTIIQTIWGIGLFIIGSIIFGMLFCADAGNNNKKRFVSILKKIEPQLESHWRYKYNDSKCIFEFNNDIYVEYLDSKDRINHQPNNDIRRKYGLIRLKLKKAMIIETKKLTVSIENIDYNKDNNEIENKYNDDNDDDDNESRISGLSPKRTKFSDKDNYVEMADNSQQRNDTPESPIGADATTLSPSVDAITIPVATAAAAAAGGGGGGGTVVGGDNIISLQQSERNNDENNNIPEIVAGIEKNRNKNDKNNNNNNNDKNENVAMNTKTRQRPNSVYIDEDEFEQKGNESDESDSMLGHNYQDNDKPKSLPAIKDNENEEQFKD